jgi:hypothetical protein
MRKKIVLGTILMLSVLIVTIVVSIAPAFGNRDDPGIVAYGTGARVTFKMPPPGGAAAGHPTDISISVWGFGRRSETGAFDYMQVQVWVPALNNYLLVATVWDIPIPAWWKEMWNGSAVYYETSAGVIRNNAIQVADKGLDVWMENTKTECGFGQKSWNAASANTLIANLTVPLQISTAGLPPTFGLSNFTLPPLTLRFIEIGEGYFEEGTAGLPTGYTVNIKETRTPAWVYVAISTWINGEPKLEVVGHLAAHGSYAWIPPAS